MHIPRNIDLGTGSRLEVRCRHVLEEDILDLHRECHRANDRRESRLFHVAQNAREFGAVANIAGICLGRDALLL